MGNDTMLVAPCPCFAECKGLLDNYGRCNRCSHGWDMRGVKPMWFSKTMRDLVKEAKVTICQLASRSQVSEQTVRSVVAGHLSPTIDVAEKMLKALGYELEVVKAAEAVTKVVEAEAPPQPEADSYCYNCGSEGTLARHNGKTFRCQKCGAVTDV